MVSEHSEEDFSSIESLKGHSASRAFFFFFLLNKNKNTVISEAENTDLLVELAENERVNLNLGYSPQSLLL